MFVLTLIIPRTSKVLGYMLRIKDNPGVRITGRVSKKKKDGKHIFTDSRSLEFACSILFQQQQQTVVLLKCEEISQIEGKCIEIVCKYMMVSAYQWG